jgi:glutamyl-tRNA synthetase
MRPRTRGNGGARRVWTAPGGPCYAFGAMADPDVRVRIAPSPTGDPHVGTAYIALFNYVFAKKSGGKFILRIEDTDRVRSTKDSEDAILRALKWVGLSWDEGPDIGGPYGPYRQSERAQIYAEHAQLLMSSKNAYRCFCSESRLQALRAQQMAEKKQLGYDGHCRNLPPAESEARRAAGEPFVVRLAMPKEGATVITDGLRGPVEFQNATVDDQVLLKSDGFPTYHLANVVDDHLMRITHVVRAEEWITSTPKHLQLYKAFGWEPPRFYHMPLLRNADKSKISKRKNPVSLDYYRDAGYLAEALLNFLGLMGFSFGGDREKFTLPEMIEAFDWSKVSTGGPVFDLAKLSWLNGLYIRELTPAKLIERLVQWRLSPAFLEQLAPLVLQRVERLDQFIPATDFFFAGDLDYGATLADMIPKGRDKKDTSKALSELADELDGVRPFTVAAVEPAVRAYADKIGWPTKELFMAVRLAATGRAASPPLFDTLIVIGKELVRRRLRKAAEALRAMK